MKSDFIARIAMLAVIAALGLVPAHAQKGAADGEWRYYGGDAGSTKYSPLDQIDKGNVKDLRIAWRWDSPDNAIAAENRRQTPSAFKVTPLMVDGVLYVATSLSLVAAVDAATGKQLWVFDTGSREAGRPTNLGWNHRGVGYWSDGSEARILMPTGDAHLWAIDAKTGEPIEGFGESGKVDLTKGMRRPVNRRYYTVMSAPLVVGDIVVVGSSIFDGPSRKEMPPGDVRGFDVRTGKQVWTFQSVPQPGEFGNDTWEGGSWEYTGNTNVWTGMSADPELGYVYLPFGTPTNDWYGGHRPGNNLFAESLVCVDAKTGKRVWHFQMVHHGLWDYDLPAAPNLIDITVDGKQIKAVAQISKQGFCYVFDRVTGKPVWPIEEREVPQSEVPGEMTSPTQPFPTKPLPYEQQGIGEHNIVNFTPEIKAEAMASLDEYRWGPIFTPPSLKGTINVPGWGGGANWTGAAVDPETATIYIPSSTGPMTVSLIEPDAARSNFRYVRGGGAFGGGGLRGPKGLPLLRPPYGRITAIDLNTGDHAWMVPHGDGMRQRIIDAGIEDPGPVGSGGTGPVVTKTLLFIGQGGRTSRGRGGTSNATLRAFDKATGEVIHEMELPSRPAGTPMTYMTGGKQYICMAVGGRAQAGLIALALP